VEILRSIPEAKGSFGQTRKGGRREDLDYKRGRGGYYRRQKKLQDMLANIKKNGADGSSPGGGEGEREHPISEGVKEKFVE